MITSTLELFVKKHNLFYVLTFSFLVIALPAWSQQRPNIIVFIADDAGWRDFGCYGNSAIKTPHIDQLAKQGTKFNQAFLTTPQCSPTRTSLLSGQFAHTIRTEDLHSPLEESVVIIPDQLKAAGYYTALLGKSHLGQEATNKFDAFFPGQGNPMPQDFAKVLSSSTESPFFAWYAFIDPHRDYQENTIADPHDPANVIVPPYLADTPDTRKDLAMYYDEIARMDRNIGEVLRMLKEEGKRNNTLIFFMSDNGKPFTRAKGTLYDEGIKTPFLAVWPGRIRPGSTKEALTSMIHLAPTILEAAGVEKGENMYGQSLLPLMFGQSVESDDFVFAERNWHDCDEHMRSVRSDSFKLIYNAYIEWPHGTAADLAGSLAHQSLLALKKEGKLSAEQSLIFQSPRPVIEFYNVKEDPWEFNNLAYDAQYRPLIQKHMKALMGWMETTDDFDPHFRRRYDNTDRVTGTIFMMGRPGVYNELKKEEESYLKRKLESTF
ncbi:sulfatase family protein [Catalinimonas niigatensis]|uniref:sulfatase family protein n=1 Tax=Catalinimonas niigatensis TaxID=1397264 RepID=UPI0026667AE5|nr:sulfatase [Catalinimonas niigatensis]WPP51271.1 sulfatase [Catalinimonas niigatensis]